jgi:predicted acylesterase/phospholipase RssA
MMKFCAETTRPYAVRTLASLNTIMIDGTGMCGGCRVEVGEETKFVCVDGPEFDGHLVDFDELRKYNKKKLFICATNVKTNNLKIFNGRNINIDSVMASTALPSVFQAVKIGNDYYWDGGYMGNPPLSPLILNSKINDLILIKLNSILFPAMDLKSFNLSFNEF